MEGYSKSEHREARRAAMVVYGAMFLAFAAWAATLCGVVWGAGTPTADGKPSAPPLLQNKTFGPAALWVLPVSKASYADKVAMRARLVASLNATQLFTNSDITRYAAVPNPATPVTVVRSSPSSSSSTRPTPFASASNNNPVSSP